MPYWRSWGSQRLFDTGQERTMTVIYGGFILIAIIVGTIYIAGLGRPVVRPKRNTNGSDSVVYHSNTYSSHDSDGGGGSDGSSGTDGGSSGGGDGGGGGGGD
jgi:uncharacterized membrane protein YgcG